MRLNFRKLIIFQTLTIFTILSLACTKKDVDELLDTGYVVYTIPKGAHSSSSSLAIINKNELNFLALFDNTCKYQALDTINQWDINKLYGFSDCSSDHQQNSARFGWRWLDNRLEIHAYCYKNGERLSQFITAVDMNKESTYKLKAQGTKYIFTVNNTTVEMDRGCDTENSRYRLYPYFGGDETAPHEVNIKIKEF